MGVLKSAGPEAGNPNLTLNSTEKGTPKMLNFLKVAVQRFMVPL